MTTADQTVATDRLTELETVIEHGFERFVLVGLALAEIRDSELWQGSYTSFKDYCETKWGKSRAYAYRLIGAAAVTYELSTVIDTASITTVAQANALTKVEPTLRQPVVQVIHDLVPGQKTAGAILEVANVLRESLITGAIEMGDDGQIKLSDAHKVAVTEAVFERQQRQRQHLEASQNPPVLDIDTTARQGIDFSTVAAVSGFDPETAVNIKVYKRPRSISLIVRKL